MPPTIAQSRKHRLEQLFDAVFDLDSTEQASYLDHHCADDLALRREVEALLAAARRDTDSGLKQRLASLHQDQATRQLRQPFALATAEEEQDTLVASSPWSSAAVTSSPSRPRAAGSRPDQSLPAHAPSVERAASEELLDDTPSGEWTVPGTRIEQYELIRELGQGGMGTVHLARDTKLGRRVAIKFLQRVEPKYRERFILEARTTARCNHENIVVIHEVNEHRGQPFMVLEYLHGKPLTKLVAGQVLPPERAVELMIPVVRALVCAHAENIVHRDLKPDNIFVASTGHIKVLDFGIAKYVRQHKQVELIKTQNSTLMETSLGPLPNTQVGMLVGTLRYMSPEQWGVGEVDHRTDLWAVGILLFQMVTGRHPLHELRGLDLGMSVRQLDTPMPSVRAHRPEVPPRLADLIDRCLIKYKEKRIASARKLMDELEKLSPRLLHYDLSSGENPYAGLKAFQERDAQRFFGRSSEISCMLALLRDQPLVGVIGPSGVGKSSLVRAGVIPALKNSGETWDALVIRPGRRPMEALAAAVTPMIQTAAMNLAETVTKQEAIARRFRHEPGFLGVLLRARAQAQKGKTLLFVDQFEELYTLLGDPRERAAFIACLRAVADDVTAPLRVMLSIRADFLHRVAEDQAFMTELMAGLFFVAPPERDSLREILTQPADMAGYQFESEDMVQAMLERLQGTSGALPLLQFAATKLWELRDQERRVLTWASYQRIGGVDGALASHADTIVSNLSPRHRDLTRSILLRLITAEGTRAIASMDELWLLSTHPVEVQQLVDCLVDARLLVMQGGEHGQGATVEIVHESLIQSWPQLRRWLDESKDDIAFLERLRTTAAQWYTSGRQVGLLWRGDAATEAERWARRYQGELPTIQRQYVDAVLHLLRRSRRNKRIAVIAAMGALSILVVASVVVTLLIREAQQEALVQARNYASALGQIHQLTERLGSQDSEDDQRVRDEIRALANIAGGEPGAHVAGDGAEKPALAVDGQSMRSGSAHEKTRVRNEQAPPDEQVERENAILRELIAELQENIRELTERPPSDPRIPGLRKLISELESKNDELNKEFNRLKTSKGCKVDGKVAPDILEENDRP